MLHIHVHYCGFLRVLRFPPPIKLTATHITEILLKVALNTIKQTNKVKTCIVVLEIQKCMVIHFMKH